MAADKGKTEAMARKHYAAAAEAYLDGRSGSLLCARPAGHDDMQWSDAWLLIAVCGAQGKGTAAALRDIIAAGDGINHAIFTDEELAGGFARLARDGWIAVDGETCAVAERFRDQWRGRRIDRLRSVHAQLDAVRDMIGAPPWSRNT